MGRSVMTHPRATATVYFNWSAGYCPNCEMLTTTDDYHCPECGGELEPDVDEGFLFQEEIEYIQDHIMERFPSFDKADDWYGREVHIIAENKLCQLTLSEYCGTVALELVPIEYDSGYGDPDITGLAEHWIDTYGGPWLEKCYGRMKKIVTMSNGESVYRVNA